jgi:hypothetical protein
MAALIVAKDYVLAAYCEARNWLSHEDAVSQVAGETGQAVETVLAVIDEEVASAPGN